MPLPDRFNLKYNKKYLSYIDEDSELHGFLQFSGDDPLSAYSIFEVEKAKTADEFFSIRSVYNDKYCVCRFENDENWIVVEADEPNEDQSSLLCTLFEWISINEDAHAIQLRHVNLDMVVRVSEGSSKFPLCIFAATSATGSDSSDPHGSDVFEFSILTKEEIPTYAFQGDNGKYLRVEVINHIPHLKFSANHIDDLSRFKCRHNENRAKIKSQFNDKYWSYNLRWVCADSSHDDPNTLFHYEVLEKTEDQELIALRIGHFYCQRQTSGSMMDCFIANAPEITKEAELHVVTTKKGCK